MATTYYVDSNATSSGAPYNSWETAAPTLATIAAIDVAGDTIWVAHDHSESTAGQISLNWAGGTGTQTRIICADSTSGEPPTTRAITAVIATTGANNIFIVGTGSVYIYGLVFDAGDGSSSASIIVQSSVSDVTLEKCDLILGGTGSSSDIDLTDSGSQFARFIDCRIKFGAAGHTVDHDGSAEIYGGSCISGSAQVNNFFSMGIPMGRIFVDGFDFSLMGTGMDIFASQSGDGLKGVLRNCKLPSGWLGVITTATEGNDSRYSLYNCDDGDTNYRMSIHDTFLGAIDAETTIIRTGGASDGDTGLSWKMVTNNKPEWPNKALRSDEIVQWNTTVGSEITATVEIVHDSQGSGTDSDMTDQECWLVVQYLGTSGFPLSLFVSDVGDYVTAAADQASSAVTWTTTGLSTPVKQALSVSFTPQEVGYIHAVVHMAGGSDTCYVDPLITIT